MTNGTIPHLPGERKPKALGVVGAVVVGLVIVLVIVVGVYAFMVLQRRSAGGPAVSPAPAVADGDELNPFAAAEVTNPLEGAEEENPFYINPFAQYKESALQENEPAANPFSSSAP